MKFQIKSRWSLKTMFECELDTAFDNASEGIKIGGRLIWEDGILKMLAKRHIAEPVG